MTVTFYARISIIRIKCSRWYTIYIYPLGEWLICCNGLNSHKETANSSITAVDHYNALALLRFQRIYLQHSTIQNVFACSLYAIVRLILKLLLSFYIRFPPFFSVGDLIAKLLICIKLILNNNDGNQSFAILRTNSAETKWMLHKIVVQNWTFTEAFYWTVILETIDWHSAMN